MKSTAQRTADSPPTNGDSPPLWEQLRHVQLHVSEALFDLHAAGVPFEDVAAAWLWLDALAASQDG